MKKTLNDKILENIKSGGKPQIDVFDTATAGLAIRVTENGKKSWSFTFTAPATRKRARITLGTYPATGLAEARHRAIKAQGQVEAGTDPRDVALVTLVPKTLAELIEERLDLDVRNQTPPVRTAAEIERRYKKYVIPLVGSVAVQDFQIDPHYNKVIDPLVKRGKLRQSGIVHTDLITLFKFGVRRGVIKYSPIAETETRDPKNVRKRFLSLPEIVAVWQGLPNVLKLSKRCQLILKLLLVTGQRESEVCEAKRTEIDWGKCIWTIPAERVKNGDKYGDHVVPLSGLAMMLFRLAAGMSNSAYLFPNDDTKGPMSAQVIASTVRRASEPRAELPLGKFGIQKWTPHDLRRTVGTQMLNKENRLGIPKFDKYLVLNHRSATKGNVSDEVYDQNEYLDEKREALDKWGAFLATLVGEEIEQQEAA